MAQTTNFNWETPDDTDLVKDGASAIRTLGNSIDTSFVDLKGGTTGQVLSKNSNTDLDFTWVAQDDSNAIQNAIVDAKGDLITATAADTPARLAVGTNGQVLQADSTTATGLKWADSSSGGMTLISTTTLSGTTTTLSSIPSTYTDLFLLLSGVTININDREMMILPNNNNSLSTQSVAVRGAVTSTSNQAINLSEGNSILRTGGNNAWAIKFFNYASTSVYKTYEMSGMYQDPGNTRRGLVGGGVYLSTSAISSIVIENGGDTFAGGTALLYGVK